MEFFFSVNKTTVICNFDSFFFLHHNNFMFLLLFLTTDPPLVSLRLGSTLIVDDIKEGDDLYMECQIQANPKFSKMYWMHDVSWNEKRKMRKLWWIIIPFTLLFIVYDEYKRRRSVEFKFEVYGRFCSVLVSSMRLDVD